MQSLHFIRRLTTAVTAAVITTGLLVPPVAFAQPKTDDKDATKAGDNDPVYSCHKSSGMVSVSFKPETELKELIAWAMGFTCKNYIIDPRTVSTGKKVTIIAPNKVSAADAYEMFLIALSTMGLTIVPKGPVFRIVESNQAKTETVPIIKKGVPANSDQMVRYLLRPTYAQTETLRAALDSIRSGSGVVQAVGSLILITDYASQVRDMMSLAKSIDVPGNSDGIYTITVKFADATQLQGKLNEILGVTSGGGGAGGGQAATKSRPNTPGQPPGAGGGGGDDASNAVPSKILVDDRTNTLVVVSSEAGYLRVKSLVDRLDINLDTEGGSSIHVYHLDNALADEIATTLNSVMGQALVLGGVQTSSLRSLDLTSLISATGLIGGLVGSPLANSQTILGKSIPSYAVLFQALANQANTNILSAPHIICINNEKTEFSVGNNIPYKKGLSIGGFGLPGAAGAAGGLPGSIGQNIDREKLNLVLNITPHISSEDIVRLDVEHETKDIGDKDPELGPTWTERKLKTQVVVHDQQSVVIGGLIQERDIYNVSKVPLLGDIPILGYLFKYSTKTKKKTNLLILLTPYIIKDQLDLQSIRERKTREYQEFTRSFANLNESKYEARVDYRRKRGVVEEINRAIISVEDDVAYQAQFGQRAQVKDGAVEYGTSSIDAPEDAPMPKPPIGTNPPTPTPTPTPKPAPPKGK
ncbi:MAG: hypothetical protein NT062_05600 [Proteobacteria bacterium]|nr:hypothetical protein [Pseudomonadota bacterium]